jgi:hypothetical protein
VPNLSVASRRQHDGADSADETRIRQVATVVAQPPAPRPAPALPQGDRSARPPAPSTAPQQPAPTADATRVRDVQSVQAQTSVVNGNTVLRPGDNTVIRRAPVEAAPRVQAEPPAPDVEAEQDAARRPRVGLIAAIVLGCVVVVGGGITAATLLASNGAASAQHTDAPGGDDGQIVVSSVPDPTLASAVRSADGTSVTFNWKNPKPKAQDSYQWQEEGTTHGPTSTDKPQATVTGLTPGSSVCIDVKIVRDGRTSPNPLKACSP